MEALKSIARWASKHFKALVGSMIVLFLTVRYDAQIKSAAEVVAEWSWMPIGVVGLLLALWVAVVVALWFLDSSRVYVLLKGSVDHFRGWLDRKRPPPVLPPPPLSDHEKLVVHELRKAWGAKGVVASHCLRDFFEMTMRDLKERGDWWSEALERDKKDFEAALDRFTAALEQKRSLPLTEVIAHFNTFFEVYSQTVARLQRIDAHQFKLSEGKHATHFSYWQTVNAEFRKELKGLNQWDEYNGKIAFVPSERVAALMEGRKPNYE